MVLDVALCFAHMKCTWKNHDKASGVYRRKGVEPRIFFDQYEI